MIDTKKLEEIDNSVKKQILLKKQIDQQNKDLIATKEVEMEQKMIDRIVSKEMLRSENTEAI